MFFVAKFHPDPAKQNVLMAGCQDKKVYQWDMDTGDLVQARLGALVCCAHALVHNRLVRVCSHGLGMSLTS